MEITKKPDPIGIHADDKNRAEAATKIQAFVRCRTQKTAYKKLKIERSIDELHKLFKQLIKINSKRTPRKRLSEEQATINMWNHIADKNPELAEKIAKNTKK